MLRIVVLGSAAGGGFPQWNCNCVNCRRARSGDNAVEARTQSSVAVTADGDHWFLLNASPDIRQQIEATPRLQPKAEPRHSPIAGVVLTNGDVDHVAGLLSLRERQPMTVHATGRVLGALAGNPVFGVLAAEIVQRKRLPLDREVGLHLPDGTAAGIAVTAFAVPGKVALWLEQPGLDNFGSVDEDSVGLRVRDAAGRATFFYIPGCAAMPDSLARRLLGASLVMFDGTTWTDDEMQRSGTGVKTGSRMGHMCMSGPGGSIAAFEPLGVRRRVFVHINNTNPVLRADSAERTEAEAAGWEIGRDGMEIEL